MLIEVQLVRRSYWQARFTHGVSCRVGEGRTKHEAIGHLICLAADDGNVVAGMTVTRLPDGEFAKQKAGT